jgi:hypothetical protein
LESFKFDRVSPQVKWKSDRKPISRIGRSHLAIKLPA